MFIVMEGMDGAGKSTQIELLRHYYQDKNQTVLFTREPGGTAIGERLREIVLSSEYREMDFRTEALIYAASRAQLVSEVIRPALQRGETVISDRYVVSSYVYQGIARELGVSKIAEINQFGTGGLIPDITIFLTIRQEVALQRKKKQKEPDRLEAESEDFHEKVNSGFLKIAETYPYPKAVIIAEGTPEEIHEKILERIRAVCK